MSSTSFRDMFIYEKRNSVQKFSLGNIRFILNPPFIRMFNFDDSVFCTLDSKGMKLKMHQVYSERKTIKIRNYVKIRPLS